ncbi:MAG: hypothetical protein KatS3mg022_2793 [Armatimonadota bacterium]|nr:MAG: hypothetical protein KatS3mg022_2793 [Armatimonadota bacterium]
MALFLIDIGEPWDAQPSQLRGRLVRPLSKGYYLFESEDGDLYTVATRYVGESVADVYRKDFVMVGIGKVLDSSHETIDMLGKGEIEDLIREGKLEYWAIGSLQLVEE